MVFELKGNVSSIGHFYVTMNIGDPPKQYFLDVDTGSSLTWVQCEQCDKCIKVPHPYRPTLQSTKKVSCTNRLCTDIHSDLGDKPCTDRRVCTYKVNYIDGWSSGVILQDKFSLPSRNDRPDIAFGCETNQSVQHNKQAQVDGILGLGRGKVDIFSQLKPLVTKHVIGHCLSSKGGGFLFIGDDDKVPRSGVTWYPMIQSSKHKHYSPGKGTLHSGSKPISEPMEVIFDSGATYTYFAAKPYKAIVSEVTAGLRNNSMSLKELKYHDALDLCWKGDKKFKFVDEVKTCFKSMSLIFANNNKKATMDIPPERYLVISKQGNVCLGILDGSLHLQDELNLIGDITMQDQMVIYDNEKRQLGWANYLYHIMPDSESVITSRL